MKPSHLIRGHETWWRDFDRTPATDEIARVFGAPAKTRRITWRWIFRKSRRIAVVTIYSRDCRR